MKSLSNSWCNQKLKLSKARSKEQLSWTGMLTNQATCIIALLLIPNIKTTSRCSSQRWINLKRSDMNLWKWETNLWINCQKLLSLKSNIKLLKVTISMKCSDKHSGQRGVRYLWRDLVQANICLASGKLWRRLSMVSWLLESVEGICPWLNLLNSMARLKCKKCRKSKLEKEHLKEKKVLV